MVRHTRSGHRSPAQLAALAKARAVKAARHHGSGIYGIGRHRTASAKQRAHLAAARAIMCSHMA